MDGRQTGLRGNGKLEGGVLPGMKGARRPSSGWLLAWTFVVWIAWIGRTKAETERPPALEPTLQELLGDQRGPVHYFSAKADLDDDQVSEWIVLLAGPSVCGTGGCNTLVFSEVDGGLRLVTRISVTRPPIAIAETRTSGWRDLIVHVAGGGTLPGHDARLRYDGSTYPSNPSVEPAEPMSEKEKGVVVIPAFQSFAEGTRLR
jgi:hypothetical protein